MTKKKNKPTQEYEPVSSKVKDLNKTIHEFLSNNPEYRVYNISVQRYDSMGFGGSRFWIIFKKD